MASIEQSTEMIKKAISDIEGKMTDPSFLEKLSNNGHNIASDFLNLVKIDLNFIGMQAGRSSPIYVELCEAVALIGSGCLRWATVKTRTLISSSDFRKNSPLYYSEKAKVEKCYELIKVFSNMVRQDSSAARLVLEVSYIVEKLHTQFQRRSGCYIATVIYNDPNSIEVLAFKSYRDNVLYYNYWGRVLMSIYYFLSPNIAKMLVNRKNLNRIIKNFILDPIYKKISAFQK